MTALGLVSTDVRQTAAPDAATSRLKLFMDDAFAGGASNRLWFRGRLEGVSARLAEQQAPRRWWRYWSRQPKPLQPAPLVHVHTRIGAYTFAADVPVHPDGHFEVLHSVDLPQARRGWRIARHQVTFHDQTAEACNVVLEPPENTAGVVAVLLPLEQTFPAGAIRKLTETPTVANRLTRLLQDAMQSAGPNHAVYYFAVVPREEEQSHAELALAITALGWPAGSAVVLRVARREDASSVFATALDRLRWLFAGHVPLTALNLEPTLSERLQAEMTPKEDRADVKRLLQGAADEEALERRLCGRAGARLDARLDPAGGRPTRGGLVPRHPVVFCHGMLALSLLKMQLPENRNCFASLRSFFRERGLRVLFPQVSPTSGITDRAAQLREQIRRWTDEPVNIVAHSMGGLDARHLITHLGMGERVRSLTTVSTPHHGTYLADWFIANFRNRVPLLLSLQALGVNVDGFRDCCLAECREFNERTPNVASVRYFSYGGSVSPARLSPALRRAWNLLIPVEGPNDGMVSVASAMWGEYLGTLNADHYAQTPDATFVRAGESFDCLGFYSRLVEDLARRGF